MNEKVIQFLKKIEQDEALAAKFQGVTNPDEAYALAASVQDGFTKEEFISAMEQINNGELSQDDLAAMAGGVDETGIIISGASTVTGAFIAGASAI